MIVLQGTKVTVEGHQSENSDVLRGVPEGDGCGTSTLPFFVLGIMIRKKETIALYYDRRRHKIKRKITQDTDCARKS